MFVTGPRITEIGCAVGLHSGANVLFDLTQSNTLIELNPFEISLVTFVLKELNCMLCSYQNAMRTFRLAKN